MAQKYLIPEGKTEINVIKQLHKRNLINFKLEKNKNYPEESGPSGKTTINKNIDIFGVTLGIEPVRYLILRDLDEHDRETLDTIKQSIENAVKKLFEGRSFSGNSVKLEQSEKYSNIYSFSSERPDFKLSLHIADFPKVNDDLEKFIKSTTDDYLLILALKDYTLKKIYDKEYKDTIKPDSHEVIKQKVTKEIKEVLRNNGIIFKEAKDFIRVYTTVIRHGVSPAVFVDKIIANACDEDIKEVFDSFITAASYLI